MTRDRVLKHELDEKAVDNFREYLRIPSVHPNVNYDECVNFLKRQAGDLDLPLKIVELEAEKPIVIITWLGNDPTLPSIILNSHMDVVPVFEECWTHPPFGAEKDEEGNIFARGAQDCKGVGIQYLEAIRRLKAAGIRLLRNVHITYMPDEETGGVYGMEQFVHSQEFQALNVGFAFDEGLPHPDDVIYIVYGERSIWQLTYHVNGAAGSSELIPSGTAAEKLRIVLNRAMEYRQTQKEKLESDASLTTGDVTTLNLTVMKGGCGSLGNIPDHLAISFDIRVSVTQDHEEMESMLQGWCQEAGPGTFYEFRQKEPRTEPTLLNERNPWWTALKTECDALGLNVKPVICPAAGDTRYLRRAGITALGFAPLGNTPGRMHDHNEFQNEGVFLRGIDIYCRIIPAMANLLP
ncbi:hypothetical protein ANN_02239 [Periplaneta americana]|uniref:Peptidase M20 dimerisation domain-containing protein n=1 Tax=Periplaneta americana TaxID=6978 RepID=A0ABQ8TVU7_PERAM|nr:hypothetical protein ANN_02239 [Periplaneta americana]